MRTLICRLIVVLALVFLTFGMGVTGYGADMEIGFARINITPPIGTQPGWEQFKGIESEVFVRAMFVSDGTTEIMLISCGIGGFSNEQVERLWKKIEADLDIPASNITICVTHTHSGPPTRPVEGNDAINSYCKRLEAAVIEAATQAHNNASKGKLTLGYGELPGYGFNRRFIMTDGTIQTHPQKLDPHIVRAEGPDSKDLFVFCAYDEDEKTMGTAVIFGCHSTVMERDSGKISADYPGKLCNYVSERLGQGTISLFMQGTAGNICQVNPLDGSRREVGVEWTKVMGRAIGGKAIELIESASIETRGSIRTLVKTIELPRRKIDPHLANWALNHKDVPAKGNSLTYEISDTGVERYDEIKLPKMSLTNRFKTPWWSNAYAEIIRTQLKNKDTTSKITLKAIAQDNWAMVVIPGGLFIELGNAIKEQSPFKNTIVVDHANGHNKYFPTKKVFDRGGSYEFNIGTVLFEPEASDILVEAAVEMLQTVKDM
ncbi:neutral/alkaline non-lysosomal ceramidase N-terminal domain-containing protein [Planctomycetota bacterium]